MFSFMNDFPPAPSEDRKNELQKIVDNVCEEIPTETLDAKSLNFMEFIDVFKMLAKYLQDEEKRERVIKIICEQYRHSPDDIKTIYATLREIIPSLSPQARLYAYDTLACAGRVCGGLLQFFMERLEKEEADKIRAVIIFYIMRISRFISPEDTKITVDFCKNILKDKKDNGPLTLFASACIVTRREPEEYQLGLEYLIDAVLQDQKFTDLWKSDGLESHWVTCLDGEEYQELPNRDKKWCYYAGDILRTIKQDDLIKDVLPRMVEGLQQITDPIYVMFSSIVILSLLVPTRIYPGTYFEELAPEQQTIIKRMSEIPSVVAHSLQLSRTFGFPEDFVGFVNTPLPDEFKDEKRDAILKEIESVDWASYECYYGPANEVPDVMKEVTNRSDRANIDGINSLRTSLFHNGCTYTATVKLIPFIIRLLEVPTINYKEYLIDWLSYVSVLTPYVQSLNTFNKNQFINQLGRGMGETKIWQECHAEVEKGCPVYLSYLLNNPTNVGASVNAIALLSRFPSFRDQSIPALVSFYENNEKEKSIRSSCIFAICHLLVGATFEIAKKKEEENTEMKDVEKEREEREEGEEESEEEREKRGPKIETEEILKWRERLLTNCEKHNQIITEETKERRERKKRGEGEGEGEEGEEKRAKREKRENEFIIHMAYADALAYYQLSVGEDLPDVVKRIIVHGAVHPGGEIEEERTGFGFMENLIFDPLLGYIPTFYDILLEAMPDVTADSAAPVAQALVRSAFPHVTRNFINFVNQNIEFYQLNINDLQAAAVYAIVSCDAVWDLPARLQNPVLHKLHVTLELHSPPTRDLLKISLEKREERKNSGVQFL